MNTNKVMRVLLAAAITLTGLVGFASVASAQPGDWSQCQNSGTAGTGNEDSGEGSGDATQATGDNCNNEGDADGEVGQEGSASSGDGVAGQVAGVVSAGDASVDATNRSDDVEVTTGAANGTNNANLDVRSGLAFGSDLETDTSQCLNDGSARTSNEADGENSGNASQATGDNCLNAGDADGAIGQTADAASGDGVGGQVIGVVTSAGGSADLVLDNESSDAEVETGEGDFANDSNAFVDTGVFFDVAP